MYDGACLRLDGAGLTGRGTPIDVSAAVARCTTSGRAELRVADDAPASVCADLANAFARAGMIVVLRRNGPRNARRAPRYSREGRTILRDGEAIFRVERVDLGNQRYAITPHETDVLTQEIVDRLNRGRRRRQAAEDRSATHRIFLLRTYTNGRTRWYLADPPTTWLDAKRRIAAAGLIDERIMRPTEWKLIADPPPPIRVPTDRLLPLP